MKTNPKASLLRAFLAGGAFLVLSVLPAKAAILLSDNFSSSTYYGGTPGAGASAGWYSVSAPYGGNAVSNTSYWNEQTPITGNTMCFSNNNSMAYGAFNPTTLGFAGDYIRISYDVCFQLGSSSTASFPVIGLFNSNGTYLTANNLTNSGAPALDDRRMDVRDDFSV